MTQSMIKKAIAKTYTSMIKQAIAKTYEPTENERAVMDHFLARQKEKPPAPGLKVTDKKGGRRSGPTTRI